MLVLVSFTAYAMVKHRFMDVRLVVLRGAVYVGLIMALGILWRLWRPWLARS